MMKSYIMKKDLLMNCISDVRDILELHMIFAFYLAWNKWNDHLLFLEIL